MQHHSRSHSLKPPLGRAIICLLPAIVAVLVAGCGAARPPAGQGEIVFQGTVESLTGEPAVDRLIVLFLDGKEIGRAVTRCQGTDCAFNIVAPNTYSLAGHAPSGSSAARVEVGLVPEGESRTFPAVATPDDANRNQHVYVVQALAGPQTSLPAAFRSERLGLLPGGQVVAIGGSPTGGAAETGRGAPNAGRVVVLLLLLVCCCGLLVLAAGVVAVVVLVSRGRRPPPEVSATPPVPEE